MNGRIILTGISGQGFHGVFPDERRQGQRFSVDVELSLDLTRAAESDDVAHTVDYSAVAELVHTFIVGEPVSLLERLATSICNAILQEFFLVESVRVVVHKPEAPIGVPFEDVAIVVEKSR